MVKKVIRVRLAVRLEWLISEDDFEVSDVPS